MRGNSLHGNRETPRTPAAEMSEGRSEKGNAQSSDTHVRGESDGSIVPKNPSNKGEGRWLDCSHPEAQPAERGEGREPIKGNAHQTAATRTQSRTVASNGLAGVRRRARSDKRARFTALLHHVTVNLLRDSFLALKRQAAPGVDGITWEQYEVDLESRLRDLHGRVHRGAYRAQPSRRTYIPKADGRLRPLGIAALEDKIVQQAVVMVLNSIYEEDFLGFSYGFRPGKSQHDALDSLWMALMGKKVNWVLDADIRGFFDNLRHEWLEKFIEHRVGDPRILRLIRKWLKAGVMEDGKWSGTNVGTPQGAVASPLLANVYLHYVLDLWVQQWRGRHARGDVVIVRYADDFVMGFQHRDEAERFLKDLRERFAKFGLALHPDKTRLIEFGRFATENRDRRGESKPETFDFLGFTHICGKKHWSGGFIVKRQTVAKRLRAKLQEVKAALMRGRHAPIPQQGQRLRSVVQGYLNYHAIPGNMAALEAFRTEAVHHWLFALRRRSQRSRLPWERFSKIADRWIPKPKILHPYPNDRFFAKHPR
jgi:group II intron reverse transcriptase/maturase